MNKFEAWLSVANPGDSFIYHEGSCAGGRLVHSARLAYNAGQVELVQKRVKYASHPNGVGVFSYIAQFKWDQRKPATQFEFD